MANAKAKETETETVTVPQTQAEINEITQPQNIFDATAPTDERKAARREALEAAKKAIKANEIPFVKSKDLIGVKFDIINAFPAQMKNEKTGAVEDKVKFILRLLEPFQDYKSGDVVSATKNDNMFTSAYLDYFKLFDADEEPEPMTGYTFHEIEGGTAGNKPVVLRAL